MPVTKAKRRCKARPAEQALIIKDATIHLRIARDRLRYAGAKKAADYVAKALKSAEGAYRHAYGMSFRGTTPGTANFNRASVGLPPLG